MNFDEHLKRWNNGILRGAPQRLAGVLGVSKTYVSSWRNGRNVPGEKLLREMARMFKISEHEASGLFAKAAPNTSDILKRIEDLEKAVSNLIGMLGAVVPKSKQFSRQGK